MKTVVLLVLALVSLSGCLKTAEQVRREQRVESMSQQLADSQNIVADLTVMLKSLQTQIDTLTGRVEELEQSQKALGAVDPKALAESVTVLKQQVETLSTTQAAQGDEIKQQRGFIEKVTERLGKMSSSSAAPAKTDRQTVQAALKLVNQKKWDQARAALEDIIASGSVSPADLNKAYHGLGLVEYNQKNWEKSLVLFSKIYTKYPKSSLAPSSLLHIGRALAKLDKKDESQQALQQLREQYPQSAAAKEVK